MVVTQARARLLSWLKKHSRSQAWLAAKCGVTQSSVSLWLRGLSRPEPPIRELIEALTDISHDLWLTAEERRKRDHALARFKATGTEE